MRHDIGAPASSVPHPASRKAGEAVAESLADNDVGKRERCGYGLSWAAWADSLLASSARRSMAHDFRCPERRQTFLLPPDMRDWLAEDAIVHLILDAVALMEHSAFEAAHKLGGAGQAPFAP